MAQLLSFTGRTAIITGAGGALGQVYAKALAARGCSLLLNDTGGSLSGDSSAQTENPVHSLAQYINSNGGKAVTNFSSVSKGEEIVSNALKVFGTVDILINNAGILRDKSFAKMTEEDWKTVLDVHLQGTFSLCHAVWPHMQERLYGRIVNVGSGSGLYGSFGQANYSAAKMGILGLTNTLALEGAKYNINVNLVVPVAGSRMTETVMPAEVLRRLGPDHVAPLVTFLSHESSAESGGIYEVGGGWYSKVRLQRSQGCYLASADKEVCSAEDIQASLPLIGDFESNPPSYPSSPADAIKQLFILANSEKKESPFIQKPKEEVNLSETNSETIFGCEQIFNAFYNHLKSDTAERQKLLKAAQCKLCLDLSKNSITRRYIINLREDTALIDMYSVSTLTPEALNSRPDSDATMYCSEETFLSLVRGELSLEYAYLWQQLKVKGNIKKALQAKPLLSLLKTFS